MTDRQQGLQIKVKGIVQGVGFRPFVYGLATQLHLTGWVRNSSSGVDILLNGPNEALQAFLDQLNNHPPALAKIDKITTSPFPPQNLSEFTILPSLVEDGQFVPISPDMSICADCQRELFDPSNHRYRYPFINCTNCGPRFSIIQDIPYDRPKTTMSGFKMCPVCDKEYHDPLNRRFHAQPIACEDCGPQIWFEANGTRLADREDALQLARQWLRAGKIIAIKGIGGFHLACDASNDAAVTELRSRKKRSDKAFALMAFSREIIQKYCEVSPAEADLLNSSQHPIILLESKSASTLSANVAPGQASLGFMLPYTPLHLLLLEPEADYPEVFVMTSGNSSEEPVAFEDVDALNRLSGIADGFLMNDRPIHMRVDDSVYRIIENKPYPIRRSRGYAPDAVNLPLSVQPTLACGAELKNTFCLTRDQYAFLSHHIGDLENYETLASYESGIEHFKQLFRIDPKLIVADLHPDYLSTKYAQELAQRNSLPLIQVQHHHAHLASCLADAGWSSLEPVIGLTFDGTGLGTDGVIWGGEVLIGGYAGFERRFHLSEAPLPGGEAAIRHPARIALAYLSHFGLEWNPEYSAMEALCAQDRIMLQSMLTHKINTPLTTSMGRLFDAVSALIGVRETATYEGQAAIELESACDASVTDAYTLPFEREEVQIQPLLEQIIQDLNINTSGSVISAKFHNGLAQMAVEVCDQIQRETSIRTVAFSGGVWQNKTLLIKTCELLRQKGFEVLLHHQVPTNDGGICLGQVLIANQVLKN
jgi:hydrogenase maturation protein HypF